MPVPDYQSLMLPLLRRLGEATGPTAVKDHVESIADEFALTEAERLQRIPSGQENLLTNRLHWARTYMGKAGLTASPKRGQAVITNRGRALLSENPAGISNATLSRYPEFLVWTKASQRAPGRPSETLQGGSGGDATMASEQTPAERIGQAVAELEAALRADLLDRVRRMTVVEFEGLILRLLLAMGYGQGLEEMASALGGSGDGGMDGVIHQDPLGLDRVYIQAKRYKEGNNVSSPDIRNFVGALNIHRANKGVFVTASQFTGEAQKAAEGSTVQVVLIDGARLAELMVRYKVGVLVRSMVELKDLDEGFFEA
jgi:restriction system protein